MVLAADYSWSGRSEAPDRLGYDPGAVLKKMYFGRPSSLAPLPGFDLSLPGVQQPSMVVGRIRYGKPGEILVSSDLQPQSQAVGGVIVTLNVKARQLALAFNTLIKAPEDGIPVAEVEVALTDGRQIPLNLVYGKNVRSAGDVGGTPLADRNADGVCSVVLSLGDQPVGVRAIGIKMNNSITGFELEGLEAVQ